MSALDDARAVLAEANLEPAFKVRDALAALVAEERLALGNEGDMSSALDDARVVLAETAFSPAAGDAPKVRGALAALAAECESERVQLRERLAVANASMEFMAWLLARAVEASLTPEALRALLEKIEPTALLPGGGE